MVPKNLGVVVFLCLAVNAAIAQDPTKVESKHYKLAFENEWVQVVDVHYGPHEKSNMHDHPGGVVVVLTEGHLKFTDQHGTVREVYAKPGESRWFPAHKHTVENLGDTAYNAVYIGLKTNPTTARAGFEGGHPPDETKKILMDYLLASVKR